MPLFYTDILIRSSLESETGWIGPGVVSAQTQLTGTTWGGYIQQGTFSLFSPSRGYFNALRLSTVTLQSISEF